MSEFFTDVIVRRAQARDNALAQARNTELPFPEVRVAASPIGKAQRQALAAQMRALNTLPEGDNWAYGVRATAQGRLELDPRVLATATAKVRAQARATKAVHAFAKAALV